MLNMMKVLRENIPHPKRMDFLLYLTARNHPTGTEFASHVLIPTMKQDRIFRNCYLRHDAIGTQVVIEFKDSDTSFFRHNTGRLRSIIRDNISCVYRGFVLGDNIARFGDNPDEVDMYYEVNSRGFSRTVISIGSISPIEFVRGQVGDDMDRLVTSLIDESKDLVRFDVNHSDVGEDLHLLWSELDNTRRKVEAEISELHERKGSLEKLIHSVNVRRTSLVEQAGKEYAKKSGELDERTEEYNRELRLLGVQI